MTRSFGRGQTAPATLGAANVPYAGQYGQQMTVPEIQANVGPFSTCVPEQEGDAAMCLSAKARADIMAAVDVPLSQVFASMPGNDPASTSLRDALSKSGSCAKHILFLDCAAKGYVDQGSHIPHIHTPEGSSGSTPIGPIFVKPAFWTGTTPTLPDGSTPGGQGTAPAPPAKGWSTGKKVGVAAAAGAALVAAGIGISTLLGRKKG